MIREGAALHTVALAPQVYLMPRTGDLLPSGALLSGSNLHLDLSGDLVNAGTLAGREVVALTAQNIRNLGGRIAGDTVTLAARTDLEHLGGRIEAVSSLNLQAGRDLTVASTTSTQTTAQGSRTNIDRLAGLYVTGSSGTLSAVAGRDLTLMAAEVVNAGTGATTLAAGSNLTLGTVTEQTTHNLAWDSRNYRREATTAEVGSTLKTQGDLSLLAGNDLALRAATATAEGNVALTAGRDVSIAAGRSTVVTDEASYSRSKGKGLLGSTRTVSVDIQREATDITAASISGKNVDIQAGRDATVEAGQLEARERLALAASRDLKSQAQALAKHPGWPPSPGLAKRTEHPAIPCVCLLKIPAKSYYFSNSVHSVS